MNTATRPQSSSLRFLLGYYKPYVGRVTAALLFMLPASGISLLFPALTGGIIDGIINKGSSDELVRMGIVFLALLTGQAVVGYAVSVTLARTTERVIAALRTDVYSRIIQMPMAHLNTQRVGELSSRLASDVSQIQETFSFSFLQLIRQGIFFVGSLAWIISTSLHLTIPILVGLPIIVAAAVLLGRKIRTLSSRTQDALSKTATIVEETLQSVVAVKSYVREEYEIGRYKAAIQENVQLAVRGARYRALFVAFIVFVVFGGIAAVILYGAQMVAAGEVTMGQLLSFLMYAMFTGGALGSFAELYGALQKSLGAATRLNEILQQEPESRSTGDVSRKLHSVKLDAISFSYPNRPDMKVINNLSLDIGKGARVAFVGMSGTGKSTTAALIQRLYEPTLGRIYYDGIDAQSLSLEDVRRNVGIVPQDIVLFGGTIEDNIRYGKLDADYDELLSATENANAMEFIRRFPDGLQTVVGERGITLSGGQRQRIAIARALLKNPPILILDEATSSLDAESEKLIEDALEKLMSNRTSIIIAHRLSTVRRCSAIHVFENGTIVESGTHEELLASAGLYRKWCDLQFVR